MKKLFSRLLEALRSDGRVPRSGAAVPASGADLYEDVAVNAFEVESLTKLVELLAARLGPERAAAVAAQATQAFDLTVDSAMAFASGTNLDVEFALSIYVDWNGSSEVEWQVNRIFETLELPDRWHWRPDGADATVAFQALDEWLSPRGFRLWCVRTDGDDALAFPVETAAASLARRLATDAGMFLFTLEDSAPFYGSAPSAAPRR